MVAAGVVNKSDWPSDGAVRTEGYGCLSGCWSALKATFCNQGPNHAKEREEFERTVKFLASVPLFRKQLPRSDLPRMAQSLTRREWQPGQRLVRQGDMGRAFFLIQAGEASVVTKHETCATLVPGDYFGGHTLTTNRRNVATIVAKGPAPLVTLSMSRLGFQESGIAKRMHFPKRPNILTVHRDFFSSQALSMDPPHASRGNSQASSPPPEEIKFICNAIRRNANLRALHRFSNDMLQSIARTAERREVPRGAVVARSGEFGQEFFVVRNGSFDAVLETPNDQGQQSAEAAVLHSTMAQRLLRKQDFLRTLSQARPDDSPTHRRSTGAWRSEPREGRGRLRRHLSECGTTGGSPDISHSPSRSATPPGSPKFFPPAGSEGAAPWSATQLAKLTTTSTNGSRVTLRSSSPTTPFPSSGACGSAVSGGSGGGVGGTLQRRPLKQPRQGGRTMSDVVTGLAVAPQRSQDVITALSGEAAAVAELDGFGAGATFGELSLLYNTRREATFQAREDAIVYVIGRRPFCASFNRRGQRRFKEYYKLLEEVHALSLLLSSERWELASNAMGLVEFRPGERVLQQGKVREARQWYIVFSGSGVMTQERPLAGVSPVQLATLDRGCHFGERSLLRGDVASEVNVDAGPEGMCCLTFDFEVIRVILQGIFQEEGGFVPSVHCDIEEWCAGKAKGWQRARADSQGWARQVSADGTPTCRHLSLGELRKVCTLGRGGYGEVLLVEDVMRERCYALKAVSKGLVKRQSAERQIVWERELLLMVDSPFVVRLHKTFRDEEHVYFLLEAALGGSLLELLHTRSEVFIEDSPRGSIAAFYVACLVAALEHLHERRIVYRDLKPENALLDASGYAKLCDLGFARFVLGKTNTLSGTPDYMAPEMIDFPHTHDQSVDWWSLGVLSFELLAGQPPWEDEGISEPMGRLLAIRRSQEQGRLEFPFHFPSVARDFVRQLLQKLPCRLGATGGADEVRSHTMWHDLGFDFDGLHARSLQAPVVSPQASRHLDTCELSGGGPAGQFFLDNRDNSLFVPCGDEGCDWDINF